MDFRVSLNTGMNTNPSFLSVIRQRLAERGIHPARDPGEFQCSAEVVGLTPDGVGHDRCAAILHKLRREAEATTNGDYALAVTRDPRTHERRGYSVHTTDQTTADQIAATIQRLVP